MRYASLCAPLFVAAVLAAGCQTGGSAEQQMAAANVQPLSGSEIEQTIKGNTLHRSGTTAGTDWQWAGYYRPDGTMTARAWWSHGERTGEGRWEVEGDQFCREWNNDWGGGDYGCYRLYRQGDSLTMVKVSGSGDEEGESYVMPGNPYGV